MSKHYITQFGRLLEDGGDLTRTAVSEEMPTVCPSCGAIRSEERHSKRCGWTRRGDDRVQRWA